MKAEVSLLLEEIVDAMALTDKQKSEFYPIWHKNKKLFIQHITEFGERQFERGKDQNIEFLQT